MWWLIGYVLWGLVIAVIAWRKMRRADFYEPAQAALDVASIILLWPAVVVVHFTLRGER